MAAQCCPHSQGTGRGAQDAVHWDLQLPPSPGHASLPEVEVGKGCEIPQGWVQASQAIVVEAQALQGHQLAGCLRHLGEPVPGQV